MLLECDRVTKRFGGLEALKSVSFAVKPNEIVGLVGPNGAGKSTLINIINGVIRCDSGSIRLWGNDATKMRPEEICRMGVGRTFQMAQAFPEMSVLENAMIGALFGSEGRVDAKDARERALEILGLVGLSGKAKESAGRLNATELKRLDLARALATEPKLLLLDEVATGLNPKESTKIAGLIERIREMGVTVLMVEHVMRVVMGISDRVVVLDHGEKIAEGTPTEVANHRQVIGAYLGERYAGGGRPCWK